MRARPLCTGPLCTGIAIALTLAACSSSAPHAATAAPPSSAATTTPTTQPRPHDSDGCGTKPRVTATHDATGDVALHFDSGGRQRSYRFGVPASYDENTPAPLILNLHGSGSNAIQQSVYSRLPVVGETRGYLVVTPDAINANWEISGSGPDDRFLTGLLDDIEHNYCVDLDRVYAAGISLGAWKAAITACSHQDRFAAIALVAVEVAPAQCVMPVVAFHGTADHIVPYGEGADPGVVVTGPNAGLPGVKTNMANWAKNDGCSAQKRVVAIGSDVEQWIYPGCTNGTGVEFYSIKHGDHTWPGSPINVIGRTTHTIDATKIALDWFAAHPKRS
jgi:polyhydroxybutyrate depolymerase